MVCALSIRCLEEVLDYDRLLRGDRYVLVRKFIRFLFIEPGPMCVAKFEHGVVAIPENIPEVATLHWLHVLAFAHPTLDNTGWAETNWIPRTTFGGTRVALEKRQKNIRATEITCISVTTRSETVRGLSQFAVMSRKLLFENIIEKIDQPSDLLTERIHRSECRVWSVGHQSFQGGGSLDECVVNCPLDAVNLGPTNS